MANIPATPTCLFGGRTRGFALLITITLLAFLVLLLVSLASLTRVETQVASNSRQLSGAQQNALMALNIALGQLQKYAGPDQRVTTTADLVAEKDKAGVSAPAPLHSTTTQLDVKPGSRYWTAVWGNTEQNIRYDLRPNQIPPTTNRRGATPGLLNWLVSGNESAAFTANGTLGGVNAGTGIAYTPADAVDLSDLDKPKVKGDDAILLVGANSIGSGATARQDYVAAPLVNIIAPAGSVPGMDPAGDPVTTGRYAWWIGDEGVKARVNLQNGYQQTGNAGDQIHSFITSQRSAIEFMDIDPAGTANPARLGSSYDFTSPTLLNVNTPRQLPFISANATAQTDLASVARNRFHDITASSFGVLSDTYAGGLRKDLTADIADSSSNFSYRPSDDDPVFTPINTSEANLPTWGHLRSWARTRPNASGEVSPSPATSTNAGFSPVIALASIGLDAYIDSGKNVRVAFFPVVILSNPYPVAIAPSRYDLGFRFPAGSRMSFQISPPGTTLSWTTVGTFDLGVPEIRAETDSAVAGTQSNYIHFTIDGSVIPPGETHIYRLNSAGGDYAPGMVLTRAPDSANINLTNHVLLDSTFALAPTVVTEPTPVTDAGGNPVLDAEGNQVMTTETSYYFRIWVENIARGSGNAATVAASTVEVVFAREGYLNDPDNWYQSYRIVAGNSGLGIGQRQLIHPSIVPDGATQNANDPGQSSRQRIANNWNQPTEGARAAFRLSSSFEGRGEYQAQDRFGMTQISRAWMRHGSLRAPYTRITTMETDRAVLGSAVIGATLTNDNPAAKDVAIFASYNRYAAGIGTSLDFGGSSRYATLWDVLMTPDRLFSLGQLQHVPFSRYGFQPAYVFANSMADARLSRATTYKSNMILRPGTTSTYDPFYDISWHLNRALWDRTFISGVPSTWSQADVDARNPLPNARMTLHGRGASTGLEELKFTSGTNHAYDRAAANLLVAGGFNINSTSEQAWRAILGNSMGLPSHSDYAEAGDHVDEILPYSRFSNKLSRSGNGPYTGITNTMTTDLGNAGTFRNVLYHGNRGLYLKSPSPSANTSPTALVNELARTLVREIRHRGPFMSLGDFVNRPLTASTEAAGIKGPVQTAIDTMEVAQANPRNEWFSLLGGDINGLNASHYTAFQNYDLEHYMGGPASEMNTGRDAFRLYNAFAPKYLTQADVLSTLGPLLSARSDTFTIRTYGEIRNPVTNLVEGRAWCEAIAQRIPDYVTSTDPAEKHPTDTTLSADSRKFGRAFKVVSFRWLSPSDI